MGRPSLATVRRTEILEAFARCVARQGLEGTSMQDVADEAGMKRPILRHYVGNRDALVTALAVHIAQLYRDRLDAMLAEQEPDMALERLLELLMPSTPSESAEDLLVLESLIAAARDDESVRAPMLGFVEHVLASFRKLVRTRAPELPRARVEATAYGLVSVWFNHNSLTPLRPPASHRRAALAACRALLEGV